MIDNHTRVLIGVLADNRINDPAKAATVQKLLTAHDALATEQHQLKDRIAQLTAERDTLRAALVVALKKWHSSNDGIPYWPEEYKAAKAALEPPS